MDKIIKIIETQTQAVEVVKPGLPGPPGPPDVNSLKRYNFLSEFATPSEKAAARESLELQNIDCGEF